MLWSNMDTYTIKPEADTSRDLGPDAETVVNDHGGKRAKLDYAFELVCPWAMIGLARILYEGAAKYGEWNWTQIPVKDHIRHALGHIYLFLAGRSDDDHLGHAFCRLMMAYSLYLQCRREQSNG